MLANDLDLRNISENDFNNYFYSNFHENINELISFLINSKNFISNEEFNKLYNYFDSNKKIFIELNEKKIFNYSNRYIEIIDSILANDYNNFLKLTKPRLIIAGLDLKFIKPALKYLEPYYEIKIDDWTDRSAGDIESSEKLLPWADIVFCEWMLFYAGWYSHNITKHQKLFIRAHKYEISLDEPYSIDFNNVTKVITVNYFFLELFSNVFSIPREKLAILNNFVETNIYSGEKTDDYRYNLAIVGYSPIWKGYRRGLEILNNLKQKDDKFKLYLIGKDFTDFPWAVNDPVNVNYFNACEKFIEEHNLEDSVIKCGWIDRKDMFSNIAYVLSLSDVESFHLSPAESFADSTIGLFLNWEGVDYIYPKEIIFDNLQDISNFILDSYDNDEKYLKTAEELKNYTNIEFSEDYFVNNLINIFNEDICNYSIEYFFNNLNNIYYDLFILIKDLNNENKHLANLIEEYQSMKKFKFLRSKKSFSYDLSDVLNDLIEFIEINLSEHNFHCINSDKITFNSLIISLNKIKSINKDLRNEIANFNTKQLAKLYSKSDKIEDISDYSGSKSLRIIDILDNIGVYLNYKKELAKDSLNFYYIVDNFKVDNIWDLKDSNSLKDSKKIANVIDNFKSIDYPNKKLVLLLSSKIENYVIKDIYKKYALDDVYIYSLNFIENYYLAETFIGQINFFHKCKINFKPFKIANSDYFMVLDNNFDLEKVAEINKILSDLKNNLKKVNLTNFNLKEDLKSENSSDFMYNFYSNENFEDIKDFFFNL